MQVPEGVGIFELRHAGLVRNATCVSFATTRFVKDNSYLSVMGAIARGKAFLRGSAASGAMNTEPEENIVIDYSNLEPGDDAPDPHAPKQRKPPLAQAQAQVQVHAPQPAPPAQPAQPAPTTHSAEAKQEPIATARPGSANVIVLSADPTLIDLSRDSLAGTHRVWRADDASHAADLMVAAGNAVLLLDASLADQDTRALVTEVHTQFPDLAIIVAGRRDDEHELAPLVSSGAIFRFLHKPASAERIRNFVDATQRRARAGTDYTAAPTRNNSGHGFSFSSSTAATAERPMLAMPKISVDRTWMRRWTRRSLLLVPLILAGWVLAEWQPWNKVSDLLAKSEPAAVAPTDAGDDPRVLKLLDAAGVALSQGRLVEPAGDNALELYRSVLGRDPVNRLAQRGIDSVADELLVQAERALMEQDLTRLASAVDAARSARPDHPRLAFFAEQLQTERNVQAQPGQQRAASAAVGAQLDASAAETTAGRVQNLVQLANDRMRSKRLTGGKDSAQAYLLSARKLDPADPGVQLGITELSTQLQRSSQQAIRENRLDDASNLLLSAVTLDVNQSEIASLRADLEAARVSNVRADRTKLLLLANQRIAQGRLIEPSSDSARHYIDLLRAADPSFDGLADTSALLATRALTEARAFAVSGNADRADVMLGTAADAGAPESELAAIAAQISAVRTASSKPKEPAVLPESRLTRTRTVAPGYPARALERSVEGWVELEYTVAADGTTRDVVVRSAEPVGIFDQAAIRAVQRWRYEPRMVNGAVVEQRVETRVRFKMEK